MFSHCMLIGLFFNQSEKPHDQKHVFIALIHPIQWTIAYPVGADRPAKRQKKTSCVSTGQAGPVLCTRQMACRTSFLSRQCDITARAKEGVRYMHGSIRTSDTNRTGLR